MPDESISPPAGRPPGPARSIRTRLIVAFCLLFICVLFLTNLISILGLPPIGLQGRLEHEREDELEQLNRGLEARVAERTAELKKANQDLVGEIRERMRVEEALRESEQSHRLLFEHSLDGVILADQDGKVLAANPEACRLLGWDRQEIVGAPRKRIVDQNDPKVIQALAERDRAGWYKGEIAMLRKDGSRMPAEITTSQLRDREGRLRRSTIFRDLTERKAAFRAKELVRQILSFSR